MRHLVTRFVSILILALGLATAASAEMWTFAHFVENEGTVAPKAFDSVLYLMNEGNPVVHHCWVVLLNDMGRQLMFNNTAICPDVFTRQSSPCLVDVDGGVKFKIHDRIAQVGGFATPRVFLGQVLLRCNEPMDNLNTTLYVTNYLADAPTASFTVDPGKILP
jgi:hypothetical protein